MEKKLIVKEGDSYVIDVQKLGFDKVLGCGNATRKYKISSPVFSKKAIDKIKKAGGEAIALKREEIQEKAPQKEQTAEAK